MAGQQAADSVAPSRTGSIRVGPEQSRPAELKQTRIGVGPGLPSVSARRFAVGPQVGSQATGAAGYEEIELDLGRDERIEARVHYPARIVRDRLGRMVQADGENAAALRTFGGWPLVLFLHGWTPEEMNENDTTRHRNAGSSQNTLCRGDLGAAGLLELYKRWDSTQKHLARAGYISVAPNLSPRRPSAREVISAFLGQSDKAANIDVTKLGLVGHSRGAQDVEEYQGGWSVPSAGARVVLGATTGTGGVTNLPGPNLTIASPHDEGSDVAFAEAEGPRHLVLFTAQWNGYSHYSYFDGLCHDGNGRGSNETASLQRSVNRRAIRAFFDHYLVGEPLRVDLGIDEENVTTEYALEND